MKTMRYISIIFSTLLIGCIFYGPAAGEQEKVPKPKLELKVLSTDHMVFIPAEIEFRLTNMTSETISDINNINHKYTGPGIAIHLVYNGKDREVNYPEYPTSEDDLIPMTFNLEPGKSATYRTSLIIDWRYSDDLIIFKTTGTYIIYGTHPVPGYGLIESNRVEVRYREPETEHETMAVNLLKPFGNSLQYIYDPGQLDRLWQLDKLSGNDLIYRFVQSVRKVYELEPETPYKKYLKTALIQWKWYESLAKSETPPPVLKEEGFDKLGLQDLNLEEEQ